MIFFCGGGGHVPPPPPPRSYAPVAEWVYTYTCLCLSGMMYRVECPLNDLQQIDRDKCKHGNDAYQQRSGFLLNNSNTTL